MKTLAQLKIKIFADGADLPGMLELYKNPYIVGVEEFRIQGDPKRPGQFNLTLTVSTLAAKTEG